VSELGWRQLRKYVRFRTETVM